MNLLVIGNGGREHAIARKLAENNNVKKIFVNSGNGGTEVENKCQNISLKTIQEMVNFAKENDIFLTVVGPEALLVEGIADEFNNNNLLIIGADKNAARLEGSKIFAKKFMKKYNVNTAEYAEFNDYNKALVYLQNLKIFPTVIKADGLAAGKGVYIAFTFDEAASVLKSFMIDLKFGEASKKIIFEQFISGKEISVLSIYDGKTILPFISAKDHKKIGEGEIGLNTGGMGAIAPNPFFNDKYKKLFENKILIPTLNGLLKEKMNFKGFIFFGLMITDNDIFLLEYNMRLGDPETQTVLPLMESDFLELLLNAKDENLDIFDLRWKNGYSCCVTAVSGGYPEEFQKDFEIKGLDLKIDKNSIIFHAGTKKENNKFKTNGGRVLNSVSVDSNLTNAINSAYSNLKKITFKDIYYRKDIGKI